KIEMFGEVDDLDTGRNLIMGGVYGVGRRFGDRVDGAFRFGIHVNSVMVIWMRGFAGSGSTPSVTRGTYWYESSSMIPQRTSVSSVAFRNGASESASRRRLSGVCHTISTCAFDMCGIFAAFAAAHTSSSASVLARRTVCQCALRCSFNVIGGLRTSTVRT